MKRIIALLTVGIVLGLGFVFLPKEDATAKKLKERYARDHGAKPEFPGEFAAYLANLRQTPNGESPGQLNIEAKQRIQVQQAQEGVFNVPNFKFEEWGPSNFGGRVRAISVKPSDPDQILIGGVDGGVWRTLDGGQSWAPMDDFLPSLAIGSSILDPDNEDRAFIGTGEGFFNVDSARGAGIFQSDDFGTTWTQLPNTNNTNFFYVNRLAMVPGTDIIIAATRAGLFRSTDLGGTWNEVSGVSTNSRGFVDLKMDPSDTTRLYAVHYGNSDATRFMMRSTDSGANWTQLGAAEGLPTTNLSRMEIGIGTDGVIYAAVSNAATQTRGLWRSPAGGNAFAQTASATSFIERQGWYDLICGVTPGDSSQVFVGAVDIYRTTDSGSNINRSTFWNPGAGQIPQFVHADIHNITFHPTDPDIHWIGSDGGIFRTDDAGLTYTMLNSNLRITQYYGIDAHPTDRTKVYGGTQDNGTHLFFGDHEVWLQWFGGDGGFTSVDQQMPQFIYGFAPASPSNVHYGTNDGGLTTSNLPVPDTNGALFITPFTLDPSDGNRMIIGTDNVFLSEDVRLLAGSSWVDASGPLGAISAMAISPHDGGVAIVGLNGGGLFRANDLGAGNNFNSNNTGLPTGSAVTWIHFDPNDATSNTVYVTFASYAADRIWKTTDGGSNWTSISGDLPDIPLFCVTVDPTDPNRLFLGSELGLWVTESNTEGAIDWEQYNYGPAFTRIMQIRWSGDDTMWLGTHGRSIYRATRSPVDISRDAIIETECDLDMFPDANEPFQLPVTVTNSGGRTLNNTMVSLSTTYAGLTINTGTVNLGAIAPGASQTTNFDAVLDTLQNCLDVADLTVTVTHDEGTSMETFQQTVGADPNFQSGTLTEGGEGATLFMTEAQLGTDDWAQVNTQANTGAQSWFTADDPQYSDKSLISPWLDVQGGTTQIGFWLYYDMEGDATQRWDGAVLELRTETEDWFDIGNMSTLPYDGQLFNNSTLQQRFAWSGTQTTWREGTVDLGAAYNGQRIQFRFRVACDTNSANVGFWVDDISITNVQWLQSTDCDTVECQLCFMTLQEAIDAMLASVDAGEWPDPNSVLDYVNDLNNICVE